MENTELEFLLFFSSNQNKSSSVNDLTCFNHGCQHVFCIQRLRTWHVCLIFFKLSMKLYKVFLLLRCIFSSKSSCWSNASFRIVWKKMCLVLIGGVARLLTGWIGLLGISYWQPKSGKRVYLRGRGEEFGRNERGSLVLGVSIYRKGFAVNAT
ncbi:hypothetical protein YC2023_049662 [Brassica napus]